MTHKDYFKNKPELIVRRRKLRREQTRAEKILWQKLRSSRLGYKFRRQFGIDFYIVDFYCHAAKVIFELDGAIHEQREKYDARRTTHLEKRGYRVVRYTNDQVLFDEDAVLQNIIYICKQRS